MKKLLIALGLTAALALAADAGDKSNKKNQKPTAEQKALKKEMITKYDANKDGKLDREEKAKISSEDKGKLDKAGLGHKRRDKAAT